MSSSRICKSCGATLPEQLSDGTCPACGSAQDGVETPKGSGTPREKDQEFVVGSASDQTGSLQPLTGQPSTVLVEPAVKVPSPFRKPPDLPSYRQIEWVNHGGMGDVYKAVQNGTQRTVAIKVMRPSVATVPLNHERFENEARALGRVEHRGVVRVYEYGECAAGPYFSMEFVDGLTLAQVVKKDGPLRASDAAVLVRKAAEAVHAAHAVRVLHRDVKPSNVMVTAAGDVKVTDFGLAKHTDDTADDLTQTGAIVGTPSYMAPEQYADTGTPIGPAVDVYGLGGTLYYLLTAHPPHTRTLRPSGQPVVPPRTHRPDLCPILDAIVQKSLAPAPEDRYASAEQFANELQNWLDGRPTLAAPPTRGQRVRRYLFRHRRAVAAGLTMLVVLVGAAVVIRESDPKRQDARKLVGDEKLEIVGATGQPRWHDWAIRRSTLDESDQKDGTYGFYSHRYTGLILVEDPQTDHYRFRAEVRHLGGMRSADREAPTTNRAGEVGVFWGYQKVTADGVTGEVMLSADFHDLPGPTIANPADPTHRTVRVHARSFIDFPTGTLRKNETGLTPPLAFTAAQQTPGLWRTLEVEVHPDWCEVTWKDRPRDEPRVVARLQRNELDKQLASQAGFLNRAHAGDWSGLGGWSPRRPLGVLAMLSTVAIRNVEIEPLDPSP